VLRLLDTSTGSGSLECLMILSSGTVASDGLGLLYITLKNVILVSLAMAELGSGIVGWIVAPWMKNAV